MANKYQYNQKETNDDFGLWWSDYGARWYDLQRGVWGQIDPLTEKYVAWSGYNYGAGNPILMVDPDGREIVDMNGNPVGVTINEDGSLKYAFNSNYSEKELKKVQRQFTEESSPLLEAMSKSEMGRNDINTLSSISTKVTLFGSTESNQKANSHLFKDDGNLNTQEEYDKVSINVFFGNYSGDTNGFDEWIGAIMTVETGHLEKKQIALEKQGYSTNPNTEEFKKVYEPLLNKATAYRIKYRDEHNLPLDKEVFKPLDVYGIPYNEYNQKRRDEYENK